MMTAAATLGTCCAARVNNHAEDADNNDDAALLSSNAPTAEREERVACTTTTTTILTKSGVRLLASRVLMGVASLLVIIAAHQSSTKAATSANRSAAAGCGGRGDDNDVNGKGRSRSRRAHATLEKPTVNASAGACGRMSSVVCGTVSLGAGVDAEDAWAAVRDCLCGAPRGALRSVADSAVVEVRADGSRVLQQRLRWRAGPIRGTSRFRTLAQVAEAERTVNLTMLSSSSPVLRSFAGSVTVAAAAAPPAPGAVLSEGGAAAPSALVITVSQRVEAQEGLAMGLGSAPALLRRALRSQAAELLEDLRGAAMQQRESVAGRGLGLAPAAAREVTG